MAGIFNVYLKNLAPGADFGEGDMYAIGLELKSIFDQVCAHKSSPYSASDYWWDPPSASVQAHELLVYFLPSQSASLIKKKYPKMNIGSGMAGNTAWFSGATERISEVYLDVAMKFDDYQLLLAKLCFHELMHNKLEPTDLHGQGGGGLATGAEINSSTTLTTKNIELMAAALSKKIPQYQGAL
jgi:hypothetical protein